MLDKFHPCQLAVVRSRATSTRRARWGLTAAAALLMLLSASPAFASPPPGTPFQGQVICATSGCNSQSLTPFYIDRVRDPNCVANSNSPAVVYNSGTNKPIGVYIDNEVDTLGSFTNRQALVNCADKESQQLILVSEYPAEANAGVQPTVTAGGYGDTVGNMLEWYPYCNGRNYYKHSQLNPPPLGPVGPNGYMAQGAFIPSGCRSGATVAEQASLWDLEWGYVNGSTFTDPGGTTTIGDLIGTCEDSAC
jgi:hypothetical protein